MSFRSSAIFPSLAQASRLIDVRIAPGVTPEFHACELLRERLHQQPDAAFRRGVVRLEGPWDDLMHRTYENNRADGTGCPTARFVLPECAHGRTRA
jgi:hypothetical protein